MLTTGFRKASNSRPLITTAIILWICVILYLSFNFFNLENNDQKNTACQSLLDVVNGLKTRVDIGSENLQLFLKSYDSHRNASPVTEDTEKSDGRHGMAHEILRRRSLYYAKEVKYNLVQLDIINAKIGKLKDSSPKKLSTSLNDVENSVKRIKNQLLDISLYLQVDIDGIGRVNHALESQINGLHDLSHQLQSELVRLQNPIDCKTAKYVVASLNRPCAFGCNAHHLMHCFQMAYATGRTLVLSTSSGDSYTNWWIDNFLPLSNKCSVNDISSTIHNSFIDQKALDTYQAVICPYINEISSLFTWSPPAVPWHISEKLSLLHGTPFIWFTGQLAAYLMRPKFDLNEEMKMFSKNRSESPIVGIHIRRTDKINTEAAFHSLEEYMNEVERYFQFIDARRQMMSRTEEWKDDIKSPFHQRIYHQLEPIQRRVFIATDDPTVFDEAKSKYKNYTFYDSIMGIVVDILLLSKTDYIVCTFSSQVCRLAYELMQSNYLEFGDASQQFHSLDDIYYFGGQQSSPYEVIIPDDENNLQLGELVHFYGNHWNGYSKVEKLNSNRRIIAPAFKFSPRIITANMTGAH
ncbi:unnamed protein product [Heterobilharzia americana]|nr:unnamed protein product [Heterobilharzia americana]